MNDQQLMRMALVLQNQAATSLEKNLCSIISVILFDSKETVLSIESIAEKIKAGFSLDFDCSEIRNAIEKKGKGAIILDKNGASLSVPARSKLEEEDTLQQRLSHSIEKFLAVYPVKVEYDFKNLIFSYIYHSFNTNTNNLLYLLKYKSIPEDSKFNATSEEINAINTFLTWDDREKNEIIYILVSVCYEYCMLTVKKDELLSARIFQGKRFYLDANIIFRMTGIHTDERKYVTKMFIKKCQEVKITLLYTDETFDEISRVINSQVECINSFVGGQEPLSDETLQKLSASYRVNDFYRLYYAWCQIRGNDFSDFEGFRNYLFDLARSVTRGLTYTETNNIPMSENSVEFTNACASLRDFKTRNKKKKPSESSVKTDITNILYIKRKRLNPQGSIWDTNDFLVSADQYLIAWSKGQFSGVPLVVLPSVFMSIILRFTGRTDDDYSAFCRFMTLRTNDYQAFDIDVDAFIRILNGKTSEVGIKERIIDEVARQKDKYTFSNDDDYEEAVEKAFDVVLQQEGEEHKKQLLEIKKQLEEAEQRMPDEAAIRDSEKEAIRRNAIMKQTEKKFQKAKNVRNNARKLLWIFPASLLIISALICILWASNFPIASKIDALFPAKCDSFGTKLGYAGALMTLITAILTIVYNKILDGLNSEEQLDKCHSRIEKNVIRKIDEYLD